MMHEPASVLAATQIQISPGLPVPETPVALDVQAQSLEVLRELAGAAQEQLKLMRQVAEMVQQTQQQRHAAVQRWRKENPRLARNCRRAMEVFENVQKSFLHEMTEFIIENEAGLLDADFILNEFSDRFGPRLMHLTGVLNMLQQLGSGEETPGGSGKAE
jgi:hypothetical protein